MTKTDMRRELDSLPGHDKPGYRCVLRRTHFGLNGRATNVFSATNTTASDASTEDDLITKIFWAEESRMSEPDIPEKVYHIAEMEEDANDHVPDIECYKVYTGTTTELIWKRLEVDASGSRVLYIIVLHELRPITELCGDTFLHAWWETVKCHLVLWKNGVRHRDINPSNLMYRKVNGRILGVLNDFDLASIRDDPTGGVTERTGTIPFMALGLLEEQELAGNLLHTYEHDAESFIRVLIWITLRYENGRRRTTGRRLDAWLKVDSAVTSREQRRDFLFGSARLKYKPGVDHERNCKLAHECLLALMDKEVAAIRLNLKFRGRPSTLDVDTAFQQLLADNVKDFLTPPQTM